MSAEPHSGALRARIRPLGEVSPRQLGAQLLLLVASSIAAACGSGDSAPEGSAGAAPSVAATTPPSPAPLAEARAPAADALALDTAVAPPSTGSDSTSSAPIDLIDAQSNSTQPAVAGASCNPSSAGDSFEEGCRMCAGSDDCASCLCSACTDEVQRCVQTPGCMDILACGRASGCSGMACYCGNADAVSCLNGKADGACRMAIENAPGGHAPSAREPSGGPAADGAGAVAQCLQRDKNCRSVCGSP